MVENILRVLYSEVRGLHQAAYVLAAFTFGSQLLALVRDRLLAHQFGAGPELDLYYTAFRIPDLLYVLFASTLSVYVLIPFISKRIADGEPERARYLISQFFSLFTITYTAMAIVAMVFAPAIVAHLFPGFIDRTDALVPLIRILLVQPLLLGISSLLGIITQMEHRFVLYAMSPLVYNVGIIFGLIALYPIIGLPGLTIGVLLGAFGHVLIQLPTVLKSPIAPRFVLKFEFGDILTVLRTSLTRALTLSLHQIVLLGLVGLASVMTMGSVSVFQFAYNLQSVPLAIIGVSYSVAAFPLLAQFYAERRFDEFKMQITTALRHILFWSMPAIALFIVIRAQFVRVVLGSGEFDWNDTRLTAAVLALFALSLAAQAIHLLLVRALYAVGNTRLPFLVTLGSSALAFCAAFSFHGTLAAHGPFYAFIERVMRLEGVPGIEVLALPLGYSVALIIHSTVLHVLARKHLFTSIDAFFAPVVQSFLAALFGGYVAYVLLNYFVTINGTDTLLMVLSQGLLAAVGGLAGYLLAQRLFGNGELKEILDTLRRKISKRDIMVAQDEDTLAV